MKQQKKNSKIWIGIAAAVLAAGGGAAAFMGFSKQALKPDTLDIKWEDGTEIHLTDEEGDIPAQGMYSVELNSSTILDLLFPADTGWFYWKPGDSPAADDQEDQSWFFAMGYSRNYVLYYADRETGQNVPVCARPNCLHDGNEFCTASTKVYDPAAMVYHDGYLYALTTKYPDPKNRTAESGKQVLLRYAADGTEITELYDFGTGEGSSQIVAHRGYLWFVVQPRTYGAEVENPITHRTETFTSGGWQLWGYELATGKTVCAFDGSGDPNVNHVNHPPQGPIAAGDYVYFDRYWEDWSGAQGTFRVSLLTGESEQLTSSKSSLGNISQKHAFYTETTGSDENKVTKYYLYDLATAEKTELDFDFGNGISYFSFMDENYLYQDSYADWDSKERADDYISIYDYSGNLVKKVKTGFYDYPHVSSELREDNTIEHWYIGSSTIAGVQDGIVYVHVSTNGGDDSWLDDPIPHEDIGLWYCTVDDLINKDKPEWTLIHSDIPGMW